MSNYFKSLSSITLLFFATSIVVGALVYTGNLGSVLRALTAWRRNAVTPVIVTSAPTVEMVQCLEELVSLRVTVSDIYTVEQSGWFSGYKGVWLIKGDALCVTDLKHAVISDISKPTERCVQIELSKPEIRSERVDHENTRNYDLRSNACIPIFSIPQSVREEAMRQSQRIVKANVNKPEYVAQAQRQTEVALKTFCASLGYKVKVVWFDSQPAKPSGTSAPTPALAVR